MGPSLIAFSIVAIMPAFGKPALIAGHMIRLHSCSVKVKAGTGYLGLAHMLICSVVHASLYEGFPNLTLQPHSSAFFFKTLIIFFLFQSGASQIPNIYATWSHLNLFRDTSLFSESIIKSTSKQLSVPTHLPLFHTYSRSYHLLLYALMAPSVTSIKLPQLFISDCIEFETSRGLLPT